MGGGGYNGSVDRYNGSVGPYNGGFGTIMAIIGGSSPMLVTPVETLNGGEQSTGYSGGTERVQSTVVEEEYRVQSTVV